MAFLAATAIVCVIAIPCALIATSYFDRTWIIAGPGVGLFEHRGMWGFVATNPIILVLSHWCWRKSLSVFAHRRKYSTGVADREAASALLNLFIALRGKGKIVYAYYFMVVVGVLATVLNILQTLSPELVYGNDVFDAASHRYGFIATKVFLGVTFIVVYPLSVYLSASSAVAIFFFLTTIQSKKTSAIDFFDRDKCGGYSIFGQINLLVMLTQICIFSVIILLMETHAARYLSVGIPMVLMSAWVIIQSFLGVYPVHMIVREHKDLALKSVNSMLSPAFSSRESMRKFPSNLLELRRHIEDVHTFPYSDRLSWFVNAARLAPAAISVYRLMPLSL